MPPLLLVHAIDDKAVGASGCLLKDVAVAEVRIVIENALRGDVYLSPSTPRTVTQMLAKNEPETSPLSLLTARGNGPPARRLQQRLVHD